ncbi:helix-turn-helix transcriptional regulator [Streptomyces sp. TRM66268-LWL]|uniref:Helix-turn-helix transcriptional regulator n=1 Tax=Streptomyces polyasparticus TaxID=2767826 RepID=A0ABR7SPK3_9ACTN|nr:helix-turn-helix domain-containing protein [Streptomyces polyasparticus]MBC9716248.1 helix-turn-helix transcriptional regulator [Streptomyces polyasparticus]
MVKREKLLTDAKALRAYAHPTRMKLVGMLRREGPFTATRAAELTGESVASCSYHLRMLAKYGLVEQAGGGQGREKPWQATAAYTEWPEYSEDPDVAQAAAALSMTAAELYFERTIRALEQRHLLPREWQEAEMFGDSQLYLTAGELAELRAKVDALTRPYEVRNADPAQRPEGARVVEFMRMAFSFPDLPPECPAPEDHPRSGVVPAPEAHPGLHPEPTPEAHPGPHPAPAPAPEGDPS